jgi:hypothetical protein
MSKIYYDAGYTAYLIGCDYFDNPYPINTEAHRAWAEGWTRAYNRMVMKIT